MSTPCEPRGVRLANRLWAPEMSPELSELLRLPRFFLRVPRKSVELLSSTLSSPLSLCRRLAGSLRDYVRRAVRPRVGR